MLPIPKLAWVAEDHGETEEDSRREKLEKCRHECSEVSDSLYVGGADVAASTEVLQRYGITHVVNCGQPQARHGLTTLYLDFDDSPSDDVTWFVYETLEFVECARRAGGQVLIHCAAGVSRSCALAIAFLMYIESIDYEQAYEKVRLGRPVCNPNAGFVAQLRAWGERRKAKHAGEAYRAAYHRRGFVIFHLTDRAVLDPRGAFVNIGQCRVWIGRKCPEDLTEATIRFARRLSEIDGIPSTVTTMQGDDEEVGEKTEYDADYRVAKEIAPTNGDDNISEESTRSQLSISTPTTMLFEFNSARQWDHVADYDLDDLDPNSLLLLKSDDKSFVWVGKSCSKSADDDAVILSFIEETIMTANILAEVRIVRQFEETCEFFECFEKGF